MKSPKTVTLIDLEGKPIVNLSLLSTDLFDIQTTYAYVYYEKDWELNGLFKYELKLNQKIVDMTYYQCDCKETILKLCQFLNDQLTFIRNGMWETLAIYQATLGRYWEVPWYELSRDALRETRQMGKLIKLLGTTNVETIGFYQMGGIESPIFNAEKVKHLEYQNVRVSLDYFQAWKPSVETFIKEYRDVFSKLTPYEGE